MSKRIVIVMLCIILISLIFISVKTTQARQINCKTWTAIKLCFDDDPNNDPPCCNGGTPKNELNQP